MRYVLNLRTPDSATVEFRICLMPGRTIPVLVLDANLYAWPDQWNGPNRAAFERLSQELEAVHVEEPDGEIGYDCLVRYAREMADRLTLRGLRGQWKEGQGALKNRQLMCRR